VPEDRIRTIPNGIDIYNCQEKPFNRRHFDYDDTDYIFINVGSITKVKMQHLQIDAMSELVKDFPRLKLLCVGSVLEPVYYKDLRKRVKEKGLRNNVKFLENRTRKDVAGLLQMSNCFLLPSLIEGWSNAVMEAMYYCKPMILSDVGSARDVIQDSDIGLIVKNPYGDIKNLTPEIHYKYCHGHPCDNLADLKNAMIYMYDNREHFRRQGKYGRCKIKENYLSTHMCRNYEREFLNA
jgi:glycosyltransferase involved in cell wall biosynthesis